MCKFKAPGQSCCTHGMAKSLTYCLDYRAPRSPCQVPGLADRQDNPCPSEPTVKTEQWRWIRKGNGKICELMDSGNCLPAPSQLVPQAVCSVHTCTGSYWCTVGNKRVVSHSTSRAGTEDSRLLSYHCVLATHRDSLASALLDAPL